MKDYENILMLSIMKRSIFLILLTVAISSFSFAQYTAQWIKFKDGRVKFHIDDRQDGFATPVPQKRLTAITVESYNSITGQYQLVKTITLVQGYFIKDSDQTSRRLRLDEVQIKDTGGTPIQSYKFDYNTQVQLPSTASKARDYWGYYNGANNNSGFTPLPEKIDFQATDVAASTIIDIGNGVREPNPNYSQAYILRRIYFPTKGYTDFDYEPNRYLGNSINSVPKIGGGVRIKRIKSYNGTDPIPILKTFKYGNEESGYGQENFFLANSYYSTEVREHEYKLDLTVSPCLIKIGSRRVRTFFSVPPISVEPYDASTVFYPTVTEYLGDEAVNTGKSIYKFTNATDNLQSDQVAGGQPAIFTNHFRRGLLKEKHVLRNDNGVYRMVSKTVNNYEAFTDVIYGAVGYKVKKRVVSFKNGEDLKLPPQNPQDACGGINDSNNWLEGNYAIHSGDNKLISTEEYVYNNLDESKYQLTTTNYTYGNFSHQQVTRVSTTQSNGSTKSVVNRYPSDFSSLSPYSGMIASTRNMIALPVETEQQINSTKLSLEKIQWKDYGNNIIQPEKVFTQIQTNPQEQEIVYDYDDKGRIREYTTRDGITTSIIWGFSHSIPLAQVVNARSTQVAFTSFEDSGKGNWDYAASPIVSSSARTGSYVYKSSLSKSGLDPTVQSVLQLWVEGPNTLTVTTPAGSIAGQLIEAKNGWSLFSYSLGAAVSVNIGNPGSISLDDVRLFPQAGQLKNYNVKNLVGIDAVGDANNQYSTFGYDPFGRLKTVRDNNSNIVKEVAYNYKSSTDYLAQFAYEYYNNEVTYPYQKECPVGFRGSIVGYTIPAGKYTSLTSIIDANNLAFNEAQLNGQLKANNEGICTEIIYATITATNGRGDAGYKIRFEPLSGQPSLPLFNLNSGIETTTTIVVEAGTYKISIFRDTPPYPLRTFDIFGTNYANVISATKDNVTVSPTSNNTIRLWSSP
jgi:YD repeat-containing protein